MPDREAVRHALSGSLEGSARARVTDGGAVRATTAPPGTSVTCVVAGRDVVSAVRWLAGRRVDQK